MTEREIWVTAGLLVKEHGNRAAVIAAKKADAFLADGNADGRAVWIRIMRAAGALTELPESSKAAIH